MKKFLTLLAGILLLLNPAAFTQSKPWTFQQCLDTAIRRNITILQSGLSNDLNVVSLEQVKANRIPGVSASANEGFSIGKNVDPTSNQFVDQAYNSTNFSVNGNLNLFSGMQNSNTIKQYKLNIQAGKYDVEQVKNTVTLGMTNAYLQVLFALEILKTARVQADGTKAQVESTSKMVNVGKVPESNLLQMKSQYATDNLAVITAENQLSIARVNLLQLMEIPVVDTFEIVVPDFSQPEQAILATREQIYQKSLMIMPEIAGASLRTNSALMDIRISQGARWPRLNLGANLSTNYASSRKQGSQVNPENYPFYQQVWDNLGQSLNLSLSIPIYSNRQLQSNIERSKINALSAQLSEQNTKNQLRKNVEQAYVDEVAAMKKYEATRIQLDASRDSYKNSERKYAVGLLDAISFLVEKNNYYKAVSNLLQAKYDYIFKNKILDFYMGNPITF
jgi:outer membrane protein